MKYVEIFLLLYMPICYFDSASCLPSLNPIYYVVLYKKTWPTPFADNSEYKERMRINK